MNSSSAGFQQPARCPLAADDTFGPLVARCRRAFDFTLHFEEIFLSILPIALLLILAPIQIAVLYKKPPSVTAMVQQRLKLFCIAVFGGLQIAILVLWLVQTRTEQRTKTTIVSAALSVVGVLALAVLSYGEHRKSVTPSTLLNVFLVFTIIFDSVRVRTIWLMDLPQPIDILFSISLGMKVVILVLESRGKTRYLIKQGDQQRGPEETAGILSRTFFWWLNPLILLGSRKVLTIDDLCPLNENLAANSKLSAKFERVWESVSYKNSDNKLFWVLYTALKWQFLAPIPARVALVAFTICQPLLLRTLTEYLADRDMPNRANIGYGLIAAYAVVYSGIAVSTGFYWRQVYRSIVILRGILVSAIFRKTMTTSITAINNSQEVSLMSSDIQRIVDGLRSVHEVWACVLQISICTWLLYGQVAAICVIPVTFSLVCITATVLVAANSGKRQAIWMEFLERRVGITASIISSMKGIKMTGLSPTLFNLIKKLRTDELKSGTSFRVVLVNAISLGYTPQLLSPVLTFGIFIATQQTSTRILDSTRIFSSLSLIVLSTQPLLQLLQSIPQIVGAVSCLARISTYLVSESRIDNRLHPESDRNNGLKYPYIDLSETFYATEKIYLSSDLSRSPRDANNAITVSNGNFGWTKTGPPILTDMNLEITKGSLTIIVGPVASGKSTLSKALLSETPYFEGEVTICSRNVAYCSQTPWLINDSVQSNIIGYSPYDMIWYNEVIDACGLEDDFKRFPKGDQTVVGSQGIALSGGQKQRVAVARAVYSKMDIAIFDDPFSGLDAGTQQHIFTHVFGAQGILKRLETTVVLITHAAYLLPFADHIICLGNDGYITEQGSFEILNSRNGYVSSFALHDTHEPKTTEILSKSSVEGVNQTSALAQEVQLPEDISVGGGDYSIYKYYFGSIGLATMIACLILEVAFAFFSTFPSLWLAWWAQSNEQHLQNRNGYYLGVYAGFQGSGLVTIGVLAWLVCHVVIVSSGTKLHTRLADALFNAPMSFFAETDLGVILNRFSQDMLLIDTELPISLVDLVASSFTSIGQAILIANSSYYIAISYPFLVCVFYIIQKYYLCISRQMRLLDLESKSPLFSLFLESLEGLESIRAFGWEREMQQLNDDILNRSQQPFYLLFMIQRWLTLVLELVSAGLAVIVVSVAVLFRDSSSPGFTGAALVNLISFMENLKYLIVTWTNVETALGAVSRVRDFKEKAGNENLPGEISQVPPDWPSCGSIEFRQLSLRYKPEGRNTVENINMCIKAGERVAICGRSGSGKSSLVLALFQMIDISEGSILIDGLNTAIIPRQTIRERLNAVPQDPYFFQGSVRMNVDPSQIFTDAAIIEALMKVTLWEKFLDAGGLDALLDEDILSHGQRQLFCLARSILSHSKIVVMDEVTSSVDHETDALMQRLIRKEFQNRTIICIAHRLDTILDFDRVMVLDAGVLLECDTPTALLGRPSAFKALYDARAG